MLNMKTTLLRCLGCVLKKHVIKSSLHLSTGVSLSKEMQVLQTPAELLRPLNDSVKLECTYKNPDFNTFLWYQRSKGETALKLIGYIYYKTQFIEPSFRGHFNMSVDRGNTVYLHIQSLKHPEHSAEYFAAARSAP
uniref:Immunoglobulin V-set domain-containing protein n=1 Tax=Seriola lalandi dorsalis TaxID=1841481 RepID=A0A3B4XI22_SERLL